MLPYYLPYYEQPSWPIPLPIVGEVTIHAFGILVAIALVVGTWVARWHGRTRGLDPVHVVDACTWTSIAGFVVAHIVSVVFYFPDRLAEDPLQILYVWNGLSSFGGFIGGALGAYVYLRRKRLDVLEHVEAIAVGLCPGWVLGRLGCTVAHDHPGHATDFFLAFDHPRLGPIHDLGFYEFLFALFVTGVIFYIRRLRLPVGSIPALMCILYAPVRFGFDFLRTADATYLGLTPGQWLAVAMLLGGVALWVFARRRAERDVRAPARASSTDASEGEGDDDPDASEGEGDDEPGDEGESRDSDEGSGEDVEAPSEDEERRPG